MKKVITVLSFICFAIFTYGQQDQKEIKVSQEVLETYVGKYELGPGAIMSVTNEAQQLFIQLTGQQRFEVFASSQNEFFLKVVEANVTFNLDANGKAESLTLHQNGQNVPAKKIE